MTRFHWRAHAPMLATVAVAMLLYFAAGLRYDGFMQWRVFARLFSDNAFLGIAAIGMTCVIISGGIDLSVGAVVGCSSIIIATLVEQSGWHPFPAVMVALIFGTGLGLSMGGLIHAFELPPFIVTLGGMWFARGLGFVIHQESIAIDHPFLQKTYDAPMHLASSLGCSDSLAADIGGFLPTTSWLLIITVLVATIIMRWTRLGRSIYAIGGDESSAILMGVPSGRTKLAVYGLSGGCSALAGAVYSLYTFSGNASAGTMLELDAIAAAVIGGTLLSGGVGSMLGTLVGVMIFGIIQTAIVFDGTLSSWWTRIVIGGLLLGFILFQRGLHRIFRPRRVTTKTVVRRTSQK